MNEKALFPNFKLWFLCFVNGETKDFYLLIKKHFLGLRWSKFFG